MNRKRTALRAVSALAAAAAVVALATQVVPAVAQSAPGTTPVKVTVHEAKVVNQHIVLGSQSAPTTLVKTGMLAAGKYLVTASVAAVIGPNDQIVCAVGNVQNGNDGVFATAGNPANSPAPIYGTATLTDTVQVTAGQRLWLTCNAWNYGQGTYAGDAVLEAVPAIVRS